MTSRCKRTRKSKIAGKIYFFPFLFLFSLLFLSLFFYSYLRLIQIIFRKKRAGEVPRRPSTSQQGAKSASNQQEAKNVTDQQEEEEEKEEWESVARLPFTYQSPYVREKLKRAKEAAMDVEYLPYTPRNRGHNKRIKMKVNKALQRQRLERINREGFSREMRE